MELQVLHSVVGKHDSHLRDLLEKNDKIRHLWNVVNNIRRIIRFNSVLNKRLNIK